jgi:aminoglycoside phosphotransferase (APT) family kinase protein
MSIKLVFQIKSLIPQLENTGKIEFLDKGFSEDRKYVLWERGVPAYLVRLSRLEHVERRENDFHLMKEHFDRGVLCSEPIVFGVSGDVCYSITRYIIGESGEDALPKLSKEQQFEAGVDAGRELRKMHELPCPDAAFNWYEHRKAKYQRVAAKAKELNLVYPGQERIERYIEANLDLMMGIKSTFQHDDFHPGNLIIKDGRFAGVLDFNRCDWGDPIHDFFKIPQFITLVSVPFANGMMRGYFPDGIPDGFWKLYNLYVAINQPGSLVWAHQYDPKDMDFWYSRIEETAATHDFELGGAPRWFMEGCFLGIADSRG